MEIVVKMPAVKAPRKRRARHARTPLDVSFLLRSKRLNRDDGFKGPVQQPQDPTSEALLDIIPRPLEILPPDHPFDVNPYKGVAASSSAAPAPHLPASMVKSLGTEFLKMPAHVVLPEEMLSSSDNE